MSRVIAVVEGQTEQYFAQRILAPWLGERGIHLTARLVGVPGKKGGGRTYPRPRNDILRLLRQESETEITTMFDYYGMVPDSWPGRSQAVALPLGQRAPLVESEIRKDILQELGGPCNPDRLHPYVQMHEFEALLFSRPDAIAEVLTDPRHLSELRKIRESFETPEHIDDQPETHPSRRIAKLYPEFQKTVHGILAAGKIGVEAMKDSCPHFDQWISGLVERA